MSHKESVTSELLEMLVIYKQPSDYPHSYVTRRHVLRRDGTTEIDPLPLAVAVANHPASLEAARLPARSAGLVRVQGPGEDPDPCIWEVWI